MPDIVTEDALDLLTTLIDRAIGAGATAADALYLSGRSASVSWRLGALEDIDRSESADIGLRALVGNRQAMVSTGDFTEKALDESVERVVAMAKAAPEDPYADLADPDLLAAQPWPELDLFDSRTVDEQELTVLVGEAEEAALSVEGVTNSDGASASSGAVEIGLATSAGFRGGYRSTHFGLSVSAVAGTGTGMERDYDFDSVRHFTNLDHAAEIGRRAGERAVARLGPRKPKTGQVPVVFDSRVANSLLGHLAAAISGQAVARGTSFLRDKMDRRIFAEGIEIVDDPLRIRGLKSKPFDGEGVATRTTPVIRDGRLCSWLLDTATARQLDLQSNGHASRGTTAPPSPGATNLYMQPGSSSRDDMIADIKSGFLVTELMGMGVNPVTGDYSRGAAGFWIEDGAVAFPVSEGTIAGNLKDMFAALTPASDLEFRYGINAPTVRVDGMTVAGS